MYQQSAPLYKWHKDCDRHSMLGFVCANSTNNNDSGNDNGNGNGNSNGKEATITITIDTTTIKPHVHIKINVVEKEDQPFTPIVSPAFNNNMRVHYNLQTSSNNSNSDINSN